ncbi:MAG: Ig-like domain-containing protein [Lachnospiraceae bacterium]|nr:Ig-like domain-containing protein [Lachnospiraceae bacterium]
MKSNWKTILVVLTLVFVGFFASGQEAKAASPYLIKVNKRQCVVTIYKQDKNGKYTKPHKAFLCSPGNATPTGTFSLKEKIRWHELDGPCYGQYCSRIVGGVLFHSVWYYKPDPSTLSMAQYNNLGSRVSHGCVRLCVRDVKWIYDNCPSGTTVIIYNSKKPGPLGRPSAIKVSGYTGYDPTDIWTKSNPYNKKKPTITGAKAGTITYASTFNIKKGITVKNTTGMNAKKLLKTKIYYKAGKKKYKRVSKVNTKKPGIYKITYMVKDEIGRKAKVTVKKRVLTKVAITSIKLNHAKRTLYLGGTAAQTKTTLKVTKVLPKKASIKTMQITTSDAKVAAVSKKGVVTSKGAGECTITFMATDGSGVTATCKIVVKQKAKSLTLAAENTNLEVGKTTNLLPVLLPETTTNKALTFTSDNPAVATVDAAGKVTAVAPGIVTITAQTTDGTNLTATVTINVYQLEQPAAPTATPDSGQPAAGTVSTP